MFGHFWLSDGQPTRIYIFYLSQASGRVLLVSPVLLLLIIIKRNIFAMYFVIVSSTQVFRMKLLCVVTLRPYCQTPVTISTSGVTKVVVCAILSVGWCI